MVGRAISRIVEALEGCDAVALYASGAEALSALTPGSADLMIVDLGLPDMSGLSVIEQARTTGLASHFLLMSGSPLDQDERQALATACDGFVHKSADEASWVEAVFQALQTSAKPLSDDDDDALALMRASQLTGRERDVLARLARGASSEDIASELNIAIGTVRKHRENIRAKLGVSNLSAAIRVAVQMGL